MLKKIEALNKEIDALKIKKTKSDAEKGVWEKRLNEGIEEYAEKYGVDMSASSFAAIKEKLNAEIKAVEAQTIEEYEKAQKLVSLIQSGEIKEAWKMLGVDLDATEEVEEEVVVEGQEDLQGVIEAIEEVEDELSDDDFFGAELDDEEELEDGDFYVEEDEEEVKKPEVSPSKPSVSVKPVFGISFDDDDDDDEFITPATKESDSKNTIVMEDDDDDDNPFGGSFGGFGSILSGSKFDINKNK